MKLAIVGSRTFNDYELLLDTIRTYINYGFDTEVISGGAKGADAMGKKWAYEWGLPYIEFPADWEQYGKSAGFIRNQQIVDACDMVLAFWDGVSKGTQDTISKAKKVKKPTFIVYY